MYFECTNTRNGENQMNKGHFWPVAVYVSSQTYNSKTISNHAFELSVLVSVILRSHLLALVTMSSIPYICQSPNFRDELRNHIWITLNDVFFFIRSFHLDLLDNILANIYIMSLNSITNRKSNEIITFDVSCWFLSEHFKSPWS